MHLCYKIVIFTCVYKIENWELIYLTRFFSSIDATVHFFLLRTNYSFCLILLSIVADKLPYSIKILLESAIRNCDNFQVTKEDVEKIIDWENSAPKQVEIPFKPARVLLQVGVLRDEIFYWYGMLYLLLHIVSLFHFIGFHWSASCCWPCFDAGSNHGPW